MFLVTWIEGEEVNYRLARKEDLSELIEQHGTSIIVQNLTL